MLSCEATAGNLQPATRTPYFPYLLKIRKSLIFDNQIYYIFDLSLKQKNMQLNRIWNLKSLFVGSKEEPTKRKERLISSFIRTHAFSKLTVQNKILSLGKLITIFRLDCGFTPATLHRTLESLQADLHRKTNETWDELYSEPNFKIAPKISRRSR